MRRVLIWLVMLCLLSGLAWAEQESPTVTVLVYISGSDLEEGDSSASEDIEEMIRADIAPGGPLRVLVQTGGTKAWENEAIPGKKTARFEVNRDGIGLLEQMRSANMGRADTLADFLRFGQATAPADRYILVLWGHGGGATRGVCTDDLHHGDALMPEELAQGIRDGMMEKQLDGIVFDACQMSCMEVAQAVAPYGQYMVASQELSAGAGLRYDRWLGELSKDPGMDSRALYTLMVKSYLDEYRKNPFEYTCTMSVLELAHAQAFSQAAEQLYRALDEHLSKTPDEVLNRRAMLTSFGEFDGSDATDFVDALRVTEVFADLVPEACAQMWAALSELVVYSEAAQSFQGNANGISITMPYATLPWLYEITDYYGSLRGDSAYVRFVMDMAAEVEKRYIIVENEKPDFLPKEEMWAGLLDDAA